jgi:hypothetical protein
VLLECLQSTLARFGLTSSGELMAELLELCGRETDVHADAKVRDQLRFDAWQR